MVLASLTRVIGGSHGRTVLAVSAIPATGGRSDYWPGNGRTCQHDAESGLARCAAPAGCARRQARYRSIRCGHLSPDYRKHVLAGNRRRRWRRKPTAGTTRARRIAKHDTQRLEDVEWRPISIAAVDRGHWC